MQNKMTMKMRLTSSDSSYGGEESRDFLSSE